MTFREKSGDPPKIPTKIDEHRRKLFFPNLSGIIPGVFLSFKTSKNARKTRFRTGKKRFCFDPGPFPDDRASLN